MLYLIRKPQCKTLLRGVSAYVLFTFVILSILPPEGYAQGITLPTPGTMVHVSPGFTPPIVRGMTIHPENPFEFDFIIDSGDDNLQGESFKQESEKLIKYFLASLTVPEDQMWVNLSPYEKDRIIPDGFGQTEMGRDLLAQDYILKQLTASLMYPEDELGKKFWKRVRKEAKKRFGITDVPMETFNKVWIVPDKASVYVHGNNVFVVDAYLKVMLEEDYLALSNKEIKNETRTLSSQIIKEIIVPEIEKEVNEGKNFSKLRQIYHSSILATWYKQNLKNSILNKMYIDQNKVKGVDHKDQEATEKIYNQYLEAFKKGVYSFIKEEHDPVINQPIPKKYFSGGATMAKELDNAQATEFLASAPDRAMQSVKVEVELGEDAVKRGAEDLAGRIASIVRNHRRTKRITKVQLAQDVGGQTKFITHVESGEAEWIDLEKLMALSKVIGVFLLDPEQRLESEEIDFANFRINLEELRNRLGLLKNQFSAQLEFDSDGTQYLSILKGRMPQLRIFVLLKKNLTFPTIKLFNHPKEFQRYLDENYPKNEIVGAVQLKSEESSSLEDGSPNYYQWVWNPVQAGERIVQARRKKEMRQQELAAALGVSRTRTLRPIERGEASVTVARMVHLSEILEEDFVYLAFGIIGQDSREILELLDRGDMRALTIDEFLIVLQKNEEERMFEQLEEKYFSDFLDALDLETESGLVGELERVPSQSEQLTPVTRHWMPDFRFDDAQLSGDIEVKSSDEARLNPDEVRRKLAQTVFTGDDIIENTFETMVIRRRGLGFVVKIYQDDPSKPMRAVTRSGYLIAQEILGEHGLMAEVLLDTAVALRLGSGRVADFPDAIIQEEVIPLDEKIKELLASGDESSIKDLLRKKVALDRKVLRLGLFISDVSFSQYGINQSGDVVFMDLGFFTQNIRRTMPKNIPHSFFRTEEIVGYQHAMNDRGWELYRPMFYFRNYGPIGARLATYYRELVETEGLKFNSRALEQAITEEDVELYMSDIQRVLGIPRATVYHPSSIHNVVELVARRKFEREFKSAAEQELREFFVPRSGFRGVDDDIQLGQSGEDQSSDTAMTASDVQRSLMRRISRKRYAGRKSLQERLLDSVVATFGVREADHKRAERTTLSVLGAIARAPGEQRTRFQDAIVRNANIRAPTRTGGHRYMPLMLVVNNLLQGRNIFSGDPIPGLVRVSKRYTYLRKGHLYYANLPNVGEGWVSERLPNLVLDFPQKDVYRWLDVGSAFKINGAPSLELILGLESVAGKRFEAIAIDVSMPPFLYSPRTKGISDNQENYERFHSKGHVEIGGGLYLNANVPENNVMDPRFHMDPVDFISVSMTLHHLRKPGESFGWMPLHENIRFYDEEGRIIEESPLFVLTQTQRESIGRLLEILDVNGGILFLNLSNRESRLNSDLFLIIQRTAEDEFRLYSQVIPFSTQSFKFSSDYFFLPRDREGKPSLAEGIWSIYPDHPDEFFRAIRKYFVGADSLVFRYQAVNRSRWSALEDANEVIASRGNIVRIFSAYLAYVPDDDPLKERIMNEVRALDRRFPKRDAAVLGGSDWGEEKGDKALVRVVPPDELAARFVERRVAGRDVLVGFMRDGDGRIQAVYSASVDFESQRELPLQQLSVMGTGWDERREIRQISLVQVGANQNREHLATRGESQVSFGGDVSDEIRKRILAAVSTDNSFAFAGMRTTEDWESIPPEIKNIFESENILVTGSSESGEGRFSVLMAVIPPAPDRAGGRSGAILLDGMPIVMEIDGQEFVLEIKGVGNADGGFDDTTTVRGRSLRGGLLVSESSEEFESLELRRESRSFEEGRTVRAVADVTLNINGQEQGYLLRLSPGTVRSSYVYEESSDEPETQVPQKAYAMGRQMVEHFFEGLVPASHPENLIDINNGEAYVFTDYAQVYPIHSFPRTIERRDWELLDMIRNSLARVQEILGYREHGGFEAFLRGVADALSENERTREISRSEVLALVDFQAIALFFWQRFMAADYYRARKEHGWQPSFFSLLQTTPDMDLLDHIEDKTRSVYEDNEREIHQLRGESDEPSIHRREMYERWNRVLSRTGFNREGIVAVTNSREAMTAMAVGFEDWNPVAFFASDYGALWLNVWGENYDDFRIVGLHLLEEVQFLEAVLESVGDDLREDVRRNLDLARERLSNLRQSTPHTIYMALREDPDYLRNVARLPYFSGDDAVLTDAVKKKVHTDSAVVSRVGNIRLRPVESMHEEFRGIIIVTAANRSYRISIEDGRGVLERYIQNRLIPGRNMEFELDSPDNYQIDDGNVRFEFGIRRTRDVEDLDQGIFRVFLTNRNDRGGMTISVLLDVVMDKESSTTSLAGIADQVARKMAMESEIIQQFDPKTRLHIVWILVNYLLESYGPNGFRYAVTDMRHRTSGAFDFHAQIGDLFMEARREFKKLRDGAMTSQLDKMIVKGRNKNPGGIDLKPGRLNLKTQGDAIEFDVGVGDPALLNKPIDGLYPVIINITPVTNLSLLLGLEGNEDQGNPRAQLEPARELELASVE